MLDGYGAPDDRLSEIATVYRFLSDLPSLIGMRRVGLPQVLEVTEEGIAGLSGFVFIMESHISIHTYAECGFITLDVYSCREFDVEKAVAYVCSLFGVEDVETTVIERGLRFKQEGGLGKPPSEGSGQGELSSRGFLDQ